MSRMKRCRDKNSSLPIRMSQVTGTRYQPDARGSKGTTGPRDHVAERTKRSCSGFTGASGREPIEKSRYVGDLTIWMVRECCVMYLNHGEEYNKL